jgi:hypothetical protein
MRQILKSIKGSKIITSGCRFKVQNAFLFSYYAMPCMPDKIQIILFTNENTGQISPVSIRLEISDFHSSEDSGCGLLGYDTVY